MTKKIRKKESNYICHMTNLFSGNQHNERLKLDQNIQFYVRPSVSQQCQSQMPEACRHHSHGTVSFLYSHHLLLASMLSVG